ncbi:hypothetical protein LCGC14_0378220 [marine sediment metagenome]|uniref:Glycosyltransferase 2-like domain-containing protein n=1 Tax=marine sediment metagenome TaxID=412755 RepID=A0A0F9WBY3_9ZZZZ
MSDKKKRLVVVAAFGDRETQIQRLIKNFRRFLDYETIDYEIIILTTKDSNIGDTTNFSDVTIEYVERLWPAGSYRSGVRNSNYLKIAKAVDESLKRTYNQYDSLCLLDDDCFIVHRGFIDGFLIAERMGAAVPVNPRVHVKFNAMGADVRQKDIDDLQRLGVPEYMPAVNFSPFFVSPKHVQARNFLLTLQSELRDNTCRGTLALNKAAWATRFNPVLLSEFWCVCGAEAQSIKDYTQQLQGQQCSIDPIMLHLGHQQTADVFKDEIERLTN